jgi:hypothetical protein
MSRFFASSRVSVLGFITKRINWSLPETMYAALCGLLTAARFRYTMKDRIWSERQVNRKDR